MIKLFLEWRINRLKKQRDKLNIAMQGWHKTGASKSSRDASHEWVCVLIKIDQLAKLNEVTE